MAKNYLGLYVSFLKKYCKPAKKMRVVFDASNGSAGMVVAALFENSETVEAIVINKEPDGNFPAHGPNPMQDGAMNQLQKTVLENRADLGVIFDADGDRAFFIDETGAQIASEIIVALLIRYLKPKSTLIDVTAGSLVRTYSETAKIIESRVGSLFIKKMMREKDIRFGAETSGHYYFKEFGYMDSGILAALHVISAISKFGVDEKWEPSFAAWRDTLPRYFRMPEQNFTVRNKATTLRGLRTYFSGIAKKIEEKDGLTVRFDDWWFNARPSNTENLIRLNIEANNESLLKEKFDVCRNLIYGK